MENVNPHIKEKLTEKIYDLSLYIDIDKQIDIKVMRYIDDKIFGNLYNNIGLQIRATILGVIYYKFLD